MENTLKHDLCNNLPCVKIEKDVGHDALADKCENQAP